MFGLAQLAANVEQDTAAIVRLSEFVSALWLISGPSDSTIAVHFRNTESTFLKNRNSILSRRLAETLISGWSLQLVPKMSQWVPN